MEQIIITHTDKTTLALFSRANVSAISKATQKVALLKDDTVTLSVISAKLLDLRIGDTTTIYGHSYKINQLPAISKTGLHAYSYEITMEGVQYDLLDVNYLLPEKCYGDFLYTELGGQLDALLWNINRIYPGVWAIGTYPTGTKAKNMTPAGKNCLQVLQELCSEYGVEFSIAVNQNPKEGEPLYTLNIAETVGEKQPFTLQYGRGLGLYKLERTNVNNSGITTRLYCYGSSDNLGNNYGETKLHLPGTTRLTSYLDDTMAIAIYGVKEAQEDFSDIEPARVGKVTALGDNTITFVDSTMFNLNKKKDDGSTEYLIDGTSAKITFQSGGLAGYSFDVHSYDDDTKTFVINKYTDENGLVFPNPDNAAFQFAVGDEYIIEDITLPQEYIDAAENELREEGTKQLAKISQPQVSYKLTLNDDFFISMYGKGDVEFLHAGDTIHIKDTEIGVDKDIRITEISRNLLKPQSYDITLSDTVEKSTTVKVINEINDLRETVAISGTADPAKARRNWRTAQELLSMVFDPDGDYYSEKIKPLSIETTMLAVGAKSQQFVLKNVIFQANYNHDYNALYCGKGQLVHYAIEDSIRTWQLTSDTFTLSSVHSYYIYARCSKTDASANYLVISKPSPVLTEENYYYFLIGTVSSPVSEGDRKVRTISLTYGFSTINGAFVKTGRLESAAGTCYFDLDNNEIGGVIKFIKSDGTIGSMADVADQTAETKDYINNTLPDKLNDLQTQIDGKIEQWFYEYDPSDTAEPTKSWISAGTQEDHTGDLFYNTKTGNVWRYIKSNGVYSWSQLGDEDAAKALQVASDALKTAREKRRIFTAQPTTPYDAGDLWVQGGSGDILKCATARATGNYTASDWVKASKYTDDSALQSFINNKFATTISGLKTQIDGKIESYFQASDPANEWTTSEVKAVHDGDMWYNTSEKRLYRYIYDSSSSTGAWSEIQSKDALSAYELASTAKDTADGKRTVFVSQPLPPYYVGDLWLTGDSTDGDLYRCITERLNGNYNANDWVKAVYYDNTQTVIDGGVVTAGTVQLANKNSQSIVAGITGGEDESSSETEARKVRFWSGSTKENRYNAPFRVMQNGSFVATKANITGEFYATKGTFENVVINGSSRSLWNTPSAISDTDVADNIALVSDEIEVFLTEYSLKWDTTQSGRIIRIANYKWKSKVSKGYFIISAPSGKYFFEDGISKNCIILKREIIELIGYGDSSTFFGWIVLRRIPLMSQYPAGGNVRCLAMGTVTGTDTGATIRQSTFDGKIISVARQDTGIYKLTMPKVWFNNEYDSSTPFIMVCGLGNTYKKDTPQKATVRDITSTTFLVDTSDDASRNDGNFQFMIYQFLMW